MSEGMLLKRVPRSVTAYDVLCYAIPGAMFWAIIGLTEFWAFRLSTKPCDGGMKLHTPVLTALKSVASGLNAAPWAYSAIFLTIAAAIIYATGHMVATLSSFTLDRVMLNKAQGYPNTRMLALPERKCSPLTAPFYRAMFFWINIYLLLRLMAAFAGTALGGQTPIGDIAVGLMRLVECLLIFAAASMALTSVRHGPQFADRPRFVRALFSSRWLRHLEFPILHLLAWPYDRVASFLHNFFHESPLPDEMLTRYARTFERVFKMDYKDLGNENYWLPQAYVRTRIQTAADDLDNWHRLYSFSRNLSTAIFLTYCYVLLWINEHSGAFLHWAPYSSRVFMAIPIALLIAAHVMYLRYHYLYAHYYTKTILRMFATADAFVGNEAQSPPQSNGAAD